MSIINRVRSVLDHPLNRDRKADALWRYLKWQVGVRLVPGAVVFDWIHGAKFSVAKGEETLTGNVYCGLTEFTDMCFLLHALRPSDQFADVGANLGSYTILACAAVGARGVAIEPVPASHARLVENIRLNRMEDRVRLVNRAVGDAPGKGRRFQQRGPGLDGFGVVVLAPGKFSGAATVAHALGLGPVEAVMEAGAAFGAVEPPADTFDQDGVIDLDPDHPIETHSFLGQHRVQSLGLRRGTRESVQDETVGAIGRLDPLGDQFDHDVIGHQRARRHDLLYRPAQRAARGDGLAQHVAGGKLNKTISFL